MSSEVMKRVEAKDLEALRREAVDAQTLAEAAAIVEDVRARGEAAVREHAVRLGDMREGQPLLMDRNALMGELSRLDNKAWCVLARTAERIRTFAEAQRAALKEIDVEVPGGRAGHTVAPVARAGCYAPGGRFPLPSTVLMTVVPARVAGVREVFVASPRPAAVTLAAAHVAGADGLLVCGGAQAVAAMAFGVGCPAVDVVVGPGNRWVTAAKQLVVGRVGIDMLAGPSELLVIADDAADPARIAADLLAQAEHDPDALPVLVSPSEALLDGVDGELERQLADLSTAATAREALAQGFAVLVADLDEAVAISDRLAPEHLELHVDDPEALRAAHYGALFVGSEAAEVLGDYAAGPNHVLPTGSGARFGGGLSVADFLRMRTWLRIDSAAQAQPVVRDAVALARLEGLEGHARSAEARLVGG